MASYEKVCEFCNQLFITTRTKSRYCSGDCVIFGRYPKVTMNCLYCHKDFSTTASKAKKGRKFCSKRCRLKADSYVGRRYGKLVILESLIVPDRKSLRLLCKCDCGTVNHFDYATVIRGNKKNCGCEARPPIKIDITGQKFGRLTVIKFSHIVRRRRGMWLVRCDCGIEKLVDRSLLVGGNTKSCGCLYQEFIDSRTLPAHVRNFNEILNGYKNHAKARGNGFDLTEEEFRTLIFQPCFYCGAINTNARKVRNKNEYFYYNGIDRVDSSKGYEKGNVVACCIVCNRAKMAMSQEEFLAWLKRVYEYSFSNKNVV